MTSSVSSSYNDFDNSSGSRYTDSGLYPLIFICSSDFMRLVHLQKKPLLLVLRFSIPVIVSSLFIVSKATTITRLFQFSDSAKKITVYQISLNKLQVHLVSH